ncbi:ATP-binding cassette domain-containing protein [Acidiferrimicrobium sp. IK]|uniref:ABC transporter ATP-binding protein n=1 Tax=Acidiferrimicrobium sp. IK TaxID=2871700 RepID=UPI0021CB6C8A|nr:ATP-binding cassette domain-containing protein [Acidiferrimicrobium sp. IK]MCU4184953.1 ATP-binding cassette domain-containing protein [Acidiferrimicrobium sp. IK]
MSGPPAVLEVRSVAKTYDPKRRAGHEPSWALRGVNLSVNEGDTLAIVGESGSGKSTLARIVTALERPTEGSVLYRGETVSGRRERDLRDFRRRVQIVFQDPMSSLDPRMKVHDILAEPLRSLGLVDNEREQVRTLLASVELPDSAAARYPHEFSGGQRQRIAIARALGPSPELLVADEPVSALDVSVRAQILNLLSGLVADLGFTLLFVSHDMAVVRHLCRSVMVLYQGEVVEQGPTDAVFKDPRAEYTRSLLDAAPRIRHRRERGDASS